MNGIKYKGTSNPKLKSLVHDEVTLSFLKTAKDLSTNKQFESFIKGCVNAVRNDRRYDNYIHVLKENGFNRCVIFSKIDDTMAPIEMHHGPLFTLYDICAIVVEHLLKNKEEICTMDVADLVLDEHELHHIQVVMVTCTSHELIHDGEIFIHYKQAWGDSLSFLRNYKKGLRDEHLYTMLDYITDCEENGVTLDNGMLEVIKKINKFKK
jgi:hypothetical protein